LGQSLCATGILALLLICPSALAAETPSPLEPAFAACDDKRLEIDPKVPLRFRSAAVHACEELKAMTDVDSEVRLRIDASGDDVLVRARLGDGRTATRLVQAPEALEPTVEALAIVPPLAESAPPASAPIAAVTPKAPPVTGAQTVGAAPRAAAHPLLSFELAASLSGHIAGWPAVISPSLGGYAGLRSTDWLLAVTVRWDPIQALPANNVSSFEMDTAGGGFLLTRRLKWQETAADVGATAGLLVQSQSYESPQGGEKTGSAVDARIGLLGQAIFGSGYRRLLVSLGGEVSPTRLRRKLRVDDVLPPLPWWDFGLGIGAVWGEP
jgi:hypothetical protein